jgi:HlyD family secretion protein
MNDQRMLATAGVADTAPKKDGTAAPAPAAPHPAARKSFLAVLAKQKWLLAIVVVLLGGLGYYGWTLLQPEKLPPGFASSNGRIEATEIDIAAKIAGRIISIKVKEGDFVKAGQVLVQMETDTLMAQRREAEAKKHMAETSMDSAVSEVTHRKYEKTAAEALVVQREAEYDLALKNLARGKGLVGTGAMAKEEFDTRKSAVTSARAAISKAKADVAASDSAVATARTFVISARASVDAAEATIERIDADIKDSTLRAPRSGRIQFKIAQEGEVMAQGGKVLNMVDLADVYMTFFLPTSASGRVPLGADVRLVLDAAPELVIPAKVTFVADVAQFTPKTVETAEERQKLTFRVKAHIDPELLNKYIRDVKTGLPGMAYVQLDPQAQWPARLEVRLPK